MDEKDSLTRRVAGKCNISYSLGMNEAENNRVEENTPNSKQDSQHQKKLLVFFEVVSVFLLILVGFMAFYLDVFGLRLNNPPQETLKQVENDQIIEVHTVKLVYYEGDTTVWTGENGSVAEPIELNMTLNEGDVIRTASDALAIVQFDDGSVVRVNELTELRIDTVSDKEFELTQSIGETYSRVQKNSSREFVINADSALVTALGTAFDVNVDKLNNKINVTVIESAVSVKLPIKTDVIKVTQGNELNITNPIPDKFEYKAHKIKKEKLEDQWYKFNKSKDLKKDVDLGVFEDLKPSLTPSPTMKPTLSKAPSTLIPSPTSTAAAIHITSATSPEPGKVKLIWSVQGELTGQGYKILFAKEENPEYGKNPGYYVNGIDANQVEFTTEALADGGTFHFRICRFVKSDEEKMCDTYSNDVVVNIAPINWGQVDINLEKTSQTGREIAFSWEISGDGRLDRGYKLVWNKDGVPTYPKNQSEKETSLLNKLRIFVTRVFSNKVLAVVEEDPNSESTKDWGYEYISNGEARSISVALENNEFGPGEWHFRLGRYRGGYCDIYSNEVVVTIE